MKTKLGLLYGGKSAEHKVSLRTALAVIRALDLEKFEIHPIYINVDGQWIKGPQLQEPAENVAALEFSSGNQLSPLSLAPSLFQSEKEENSSLDAIFPLLHGPNGED